MKNTRKHLIHQKNTRLQKQTYTAVKMPRNALQCQPQTLYNKSLGLYLNQKTVFRCSRFSSWVRFVAASRTMFTSLSLL